MQKNKERSEKKKTKKMWEKKSEKLRSWIWILLKKNNKLIFIDKKIKNHIKLWLLSVSWAKKMIGCKPFLQ